MQSVASLAAYAGRDVLIRFRLGTDEIVSGIGWSVDDVSIDSSTTTRVTTKAAGFPTQTQEVTTQIVEPPTAPSGATVTSSTPGPGQVEVAFTPGFDGGSPVDRFYAQCVSTNGGVNQIVFGSASPLTVDGLTGGKNYHCRVKARNAVGTGPYGSYGDTVSVPPPTVPGEPTVTGSSPGVNKITVDYTPGPTGGSPITRYYAQCVSTNGGVNQIVTRTSGPIVVKPVSGDKDYRCRVKAQERSRHRFLRPLRVHGHGADVGTGCADGDQLDAGSQPGDGGFHAGAERWKSDHVVLRPVRGHQRWGQQDHDRRHQPDRGHGPGERQELPLPGQGPQHDRDRGLQQLREYRDGPLSASSPLSSWLR